MSPCLPVLHLTPSAHTAAAPKRFCSGCRRGKNKAGVGELGARGGGRADTSFGIGIDELSGESRYRLALGKVGRKSSCPQLLCVVC